MKKKVIKNCDYIIEYCLYILIFCLPFTKAGMQAFCCLAIFFWLIKKIVGAEIPIKKPLKLTNLNKPLLVFIIVCALSTIVSVDFGLSSKALLTKVIKNAIIIFLVVETINDKRRLRNILTVVIVSTSLIVIDAGIQYFSGRDFLRGFTPLGPRLQASFNNPNGFGGWLIVIMPILLGIIFSKQFMRGITKKIAICVIFVLLLFCLGMSYSRSSWIGFIISFGLIICYSFSLLNIRFKILLVVIILAFLTVVFFTMPQIMKERTPNFLPKAIKDRITSISSIENSSLFRINLWRESLEIIEDFPVFGVGLNTYSNIGPIYAKAGGGYYPHNSYLQMAAEIGAVGLICFLWFILELFRLGLHTLKQTKDSLLLGLLGAIAAFLGQSFFDVNLYALQLATLFWFVLGLTIARIKILTEA